MGSRTVTTRHVWNLYISLYICCSGIHKTLDLVSILWTIYSSHTYYIEVLKLSSLSDSRGRSKSTSLRFSFAKMKDHWYFCYLYCKWQVYKNLPPRILFPAKVSFINERDIYFQREKKKSWRFITSKPALPKEKMIKGVLQVEVKEH